MLQVLNPNVKKSFFLTLFFSVQIYSFYFQEQFCNLYIPHPKSEFFFADKTPIFLKDQGSLFLLQMKWQQKINNGFLKFFTAVQKDLNVSIKDLHDLLSNKKVTQQFKEYLNEKLTDLLNDPETVTEEKINPYLKSMLQKGIQAFIPDQNISFLTSPKLSNIVELYFDTTNDTYVICFNSNVYNMDSLRNINKYALKKKAYCFCYKAHDGKLNYVSFSDFLNSGFIIAASFIHHQLDIVLFALIHYKFLNQSALEKDILFLRRLISFQIDLEIIFQSNNPLETAYFYSRLDIFTENSEIWNLLIKDIKNMYHESSLFKFEKIKEFTQNNYN